MRPSTYKRHQENVEFSDHHLSQFHSYPSLVMHGITLALASAVVVSGVTASPASIVHSEVKQIKNPSFKPNGLRAYAKAYRMFYLLTLWLSVAHRYVDKFNKTMPALLAAAVKASNDGSVSATPSDSYDSEYVSPVNIDGQVLNLDFDTGSSDCT